MELGIDRFLETSPTLLIIVINMTKNYAFNYKGKCNQFICNKLNNNKLMIYFWIHITNCGLSRHSVPCADCSSECFVF